MTRGLELRCDGCGQVATAEHVARRLLRLEWTTRYRPVHINTLFLAAFSPLADADFLYSPSEEFSGEAVELLRAAGIGTEGKTAEVVLAEFQRAGYFLTHVLECPLEVEARSNVDRIAILAERLPVLASRIRRSYKPKRVMLITEELHALLQNMDALKLGLSGAGEVERMSKRPRPS